MKVRTLYFVSLWGAGLLLLLGACQKRQPPQMPALELPVVDVIVKDLPRTIEFVGQTYGISDITIQARVEGFLEGIHFREGLPVKKGQLLYSIDPQPFLAKEAEALGRVAEAQTMLAKAESDLNRIRPLAEANAVSESDLDAAEAQFGASQASLEAAEASLRLARIELGYTKIYAPINGVIGKTQARVGDFVGRSLNAAVLNTVSRIDTIRVEFFISERAYLNFVRMFGDPEENERKRQAEREHPGLELILADGSVHAQRGYVDFANRAIDPATGSLLLQASFPNPQRIVRPGQFARVRGVISIEEGATLVPQRCVKELQGTYQVYVVNDSSKVEIRSVQVGAKQGNLWFIEDGLKAGEKVLYEGLQRVQNGTVIKAVPADFKEVSAVSFSSQP
jgi:membrane fusion protein (multidrug efflux system)